MFHLFREPEQLQSLLSDVVAGRLPARTDPSFFHSMFGDVDGREPQRIAATRGALQSPSLSAPVSMLRDDAAAAVLARRLGLAVARDGRHGRGCGGAGRARRWGV
jgi:hypothetical protein